MNPDKLRLHPRAVAFVRTFANAGRPIAAICHGPWLLIDAGLAHGKKITSWPTLRTDLRNAGADWVDEEFVLDGQLLTSRKPGDLPAFNREMIRLFARQPTRVRATSPVMATGLGPLAAILSSADTASFRITCGRLSRMRLM